MYSKCKELLFLHVNNRPVNNAVKKEEIFLINVAKALQNNKAALSFGQEGAPYF